MLALDCFSGCQRLSVVAAPLKLEVAVHQDCMRFKLKLTERGLILIGLPLVIQVAIFAYFSQLLDKTELLAQQEFHSRSVIGRCHWISVLVMSTISGWIGYETTRDEKLLDLYRSTGANLSQEIDRLKEVVSDNPHQVRQIEKARQQIDSLLVLLASAVPSGRSEQSVPPAVKDRVMSIMNQLFDIRHELLATENARYADLAALPETRRLQRQAVAIGIGIDIIIAILLLAVYMLGITRRLHVLTDNTVRFAERKPLNPSLTGDDEVAELDGKFHAMAQALLQAEAQKQQFVQMISHDLRTPLASVLCSLELLSMQQYGLSEEGSDEINKAERNLKRTLNLINQLLELERMESGFVVLQFGDCLLSHCIHDAVSAVLDIADSENVSIVEPKLNDGVPLHADGERLIQVLINLLGNAIKFSPEGGVVTISVLEERDAIEVQVSDQGRGVPADQVERIFDRFLQVERSDCTEKGGTGLGLAICKALIEAHHGRIGVRSNEGRGSTFWFRIPITQPPEPSGKS